MNHYLLILTLAYAIYVCFVLHNQVETLKGELSFAEFEKQLLKEQLEALGKTPEGDADEEIPHE